jgi:hypothetical protein
MNRVIGEEAHIRGEKPSAARYDPHQSEEERERYNNLFYQILDMIEVGEND